MLSADFKTISHLIADHHDREIKIKRMLRALNFKIVLEMCREQGREISINDSTETIHVSKPNKVSKDSPLKNSLKQQVEHHKIQIMDSLGKIQDQNVVALPWKNMTKIYHSYRNVPKRYSDFERGWESKWIY